MYKQLSLSSRIIVNTVIQLADEMMPTKSCAFKLNHITQLFYLLKNWTPNSYSDLVQIELEFQKLILTLIGGIEKRAAQKTRKKYVKLAG